MPEKETKSQEMEPMGLMGSGAQDLNAMGSSLHTCANLSLINHDYSTDLNQRFTSLL